MWVNRATMKRIRLMLGKLKDLSWAMRRTLSCQPKPNCRYPKNSSTRSASPASPIQHKNPVVIAVIVIFVPLILPKAVAYLVVSSLPITPP
ncbi:hypothetical protein VTJ04DRAFT_3561 [Mycothermus thermophilus]|uniref:uncharacterized protein n=1 Tax=Humicola insolens TaxID=85995 RepID=UPI0037426B44